MQSVNVNNRAFPSISSWNEDYIDYMEIRDIYHKISQRKKPSVAQILELWQHSALNNICIPSEIIGKH